MARSDKATLPAARDRLGDTLMPARKKSNATAANIGFEAKLWLSADKLRSNMDAQDFRA
jgi:hypothetical protein